MSYKFVDNKDKDDRVDIKDNREVTVTNIFDDESFTFILSNEDYDVYSDDCVLKIFDICSQKYDQYNKLNNLTSKS
jgi:hypothetical protein